MTSKLTRERIEWLNYAATGLAANGTEMAMSPQDVIALTERCLAAMDSEPVAYMYDGEDGREYNGHNEFSGGGKGIPLYRHAQQPVVPENRVTAEHRRVIEMLLSVCGAAFELADDSCQQDVDGEDCHVVPNDAFQRLSNALDEIENTLPTEDIDRPDVFLAWSAMPRAALKSIIQVGNSPVIPQGSVSMLKRWLAFGRGMQNAGSQLPHNLIAETESMLAAAPQEVK
ncbi:hypothetical protein SB6411_00240 [Klebsiella spallanzanii]|uniref:Uncharacterized protein n=1 Tax=Klebsiella spallanzanii TaxID=2587528 RepID=A0ABY6V4D2_9ENTR|nr:hypothetical protein [Klebsiella spallanzanii]VUS22816.1 hypothetical protein SB6411_00240 [Klebsiella spallanzanii]